MRFGKFEITEIDTGRFKLDGGAMFGVVPRPLWEKSDQPDERNRIELALRPLLICSGSRRILIDVGMGDKWNAKLQDIYGLRNSPMNEALLKQAGLSCDDITHVLLTHMHFDHCGGLTTKQANEEPQIVFKNAEILVHAENLKTAEAPNPREKGSYLLENWLAYKKTGQIKIIESSVLEKKEILPGIWSVRSDGHTRGQQVIILDSGEGEKLLYCGDVIPSSSHVRIAWNMGYDIDAVQIMKEKEVLLTEAKKDSWLLYFEHDARGACAKLHKESSQFELQELPKAL